MSEYFGPICDACECCMCHSENVLTINNRTYTNSELYRVSLCPDCAGLVENAIKLVIGLTPKQKGE